MLRHITPNLCLVFILSSCKVFCNPLTCSSCFQYLGLQWCTSEKELNTTSFTRCLTNADLTSEWTEWCGESNVYHPSSEVEIIEDDPFTDPQTTENGKEDIIQIKPQSVLMKLSPGQTEVLTVRFKYIRSYFLELYYLMDLSKSMEQDKETITRLADDLATELQKLTPNLKLGFGSFLDKVMLPFTNTHSSWLENPCHEEGVKTCRVPYGYQNILSLTNDTNEFTEFVRRAKLSTNWDDPEGGLDAVLQAMVCSEIGWQTTATRHLIVYVTGSAFKYGGDGKIEQISVEKRMHIIFAVKENVLPLYKALAEIITQSEANELQDDSSNIIDIITTIYEDISKTLVMSDDSHKYPELKVSYASKCEEDESFKEGSWQCEDVDINEEVEFRMTFQLEKCLPRDQFLTVRVSPQGLGDELMVNITSNCECECEGDLDSLDNEEACSFHGKVACGVCICDKGFAGEFCECEHVSSSEVKREKCRRPDQLNGRECSGHGVCKCGLCECQRGISGNLNWMYQGTFCECSNFDCPKSSGLLCSDHGKCDCSKCVCELPWSGDACSCDTRTNSCLNPANNQICSGHGTCECNQCTCFALENDAAQSYFGKYCEDCQSCEGLCSSYDDCIKCMAFETGPLQDECENHCSYLEIIEAEGTQDDKKSCSYKDENGCLVIFFYNPAVEDVVYLQKEPNCSENIKPYVVIGSIVCLILLLGLLILAIWKCWVTIKDKREYNKFMKEYEQATFSNQLNPIYMDPVSRFTNPLRQED